MTQKTWTYTEITEEAERQIKIAVDLAEKSKSGADAACHRAIATGVNNFWIALVGDDCDRADEARFLRLVYQMPQPAKETDATA
ncbi:hypothetical protein F6R98_10330 [Candidatus Methylospira mobilis]|uniref:Uncharacterized protein n=1 Tax=Candidatus Methylospira mobilis TaxID=1808979 RepID=A0A5Q0BGM6_9GAMM|nr:hypothetical protein [Candidatus Methylospira mobilis]QFY42960.1 hypothetical protein F6R98_10330 [Candidatus Methylospira mobilis]